MGMLELRGPGVHGRHERRTVTPPGNGPLRCWTPARPEAREDVAVIWKEAKEALRG